MLWNGSSKNYFERYIHRMMAAQSKKGQGQIKQVQTPDSFMLLKSAGKLPAKLIYGSLQQQQVLKCLPLYSFPQPKHLSLNSRRIKSTWLGTKNSYGLNYSCAA